MFSKKQIRFNIDKIETVSQINKKTRHLSQHILRNTKQKQNQNFTCLIYDMIILIFFIYIREKKKKKKSKRNYLSGLLLRAVNIQDPCFLDIYS